MDKITLRKVQLIQLELLKYVKEICENNGIEYFLIDGTLLGAVRHKGFIPWDDDLDIAMVREDYEVFINLVSNQINDLYFLQTWNTDPNYGFPYAKLIKKNTVYQEAVSCETGIKNGVFIDIFPIDSCGCAKEMNTLKYVYLNKVLLMKCNYKPWLATNAKNSKWKYYPFILASKIFSREYIISKLESITKKYNSIYKNSNYCFENFGGDFSNLIFDKYIVDNLDKLQFEGDEFYVPQYYDDYLKIMYDNYMILPPIDQRGNQHKIISLKL